MIRCCSTGTATSRTSAVSGVIFAFKQGERLGPENQVLGSPRAGAPLDVIFCELGRVGVFRARGGRQLDGVINNMIGHRRGEHELLDPQNILRGDGRGERGQLAQRGALDDFDLLLLGGIIEMERKHEAVKLRFRERVRAFLLDGILRGDHHKWIGQVAGNARDGDLALLHRLEQRRLGLGGRAVDFVGEQQIGENGTAFVLKFKTTVPFLEQLGPNDIGGHQVGRELDALEGKVENVRQRFDQQCFGQPGDADQQAMGRGKTS